MTVSQSETYRIADLGQSLLNRKIHLRGWVRTRRGSKGFSFIQLNDGSNLSGLQVIADEKLENYEEISKLSTGAALEVWGTLVESQGTWTGFRAAIRTDPDSGNGSRRRIPSAEKRTHP